MARLNLKLGGQHLPRDPPVASAVPGRDFQNVKGGKLILHALNVYAGMHASAAPQPSISLPRELATQILAQPCLPSVRTQHLVHNYERISK